MTATQHTCVVRVNLFLFLEDTAQYKEYGSVGCAIIGTLSEIPFYKMGCYNDKNEYLCTTNITTNNETGACLALQNGGYVSFKDEQGKKWSMQFETEDHAIEFCSHFIVAMYGASGYPDDSILACDVAYGKRDRTVFANDIIKVRYQSWVIQSEKNEKKLPILGSKLDGNLHEDKPFTMIVPANHMSVNSDMKGFEGMLIGIGEEGSRLIVIPLKAKRGGGPQVHMCFYVHVVKKKDISRNIVTRDIIPITSSNSNLQIEHQSKVLPLYTTKTEIVTRPETPPPSGFSKEQLIVIDRIRDQVQVLSQQIQDSRRQLDIFMNDVRIFEKNTKPQSLTSAQIEYSIQKLLSDTEEGRELLAQKDILLKQLEEKNHELQKKVDKFTSTANLLAEEKKSTITLSNEEKLNMDRRIAQAQAQLTRLQSEREDVSRHLSTVKRLLQVSDQDIKTEKHNLQIVSVAFETNESKLAAVEENFTEEITRRKILESKVATLGDQLRGVLEEVRIKESQIEERRKKIESDKLHYMQLIEDERSKSAMDVRELRQELIDELAIRDRRYQEERQRVAQESLERGRLQGIEDGQSEVLLEADITTQKLNLTVQRYRAEVNAMRIRLRSAKEQSEADERRLNSQVTALQEALTNISIENSQMESELESLKVVNESVEEETFQKIRSAIQQLSRPVGKSDLLLLIHSLRVNKNFNYEFEVQRVEEEKKILDKEHNEVIEWVSEIVNNNFIPIPPMRTHFKPEPPVPNIPETLLLVEPEISSEIIESKLEDEINRQEEVIKFNPDEMDRRYRELLSELTNMNPYLELTPQKNTTYATGNSISKNNTLNTKEEKSLPLETSEAFFSEEKTLQEPNLEILPQEQVQSQEQQEQEEKQEAPLQQQQEPQEQAQQQQQQQQSESVENYSNIKSDEIVEKTGDPSGSIRSLVNEPEKNNLNIEQKSTTITAEKLKPNVISGNHYEQIAPPSNRGLPNQTKRFTFSDSDSDIEPPVVVSSKPVRSTFKTGPPKKSLFDDSDSSDE